MPKYTFLIRSKMDIRLYTIYSKPGGGQKGGKGVFRVICRVTPVGTDNRKRRKKRMGFIFSV